MMHPACLVLPCRFLLHAVLCRVARSYYSKVLEATAGGSLRALFGILACTANLPEKVQWGR